MGKKDDKQDAEDKARRKLARAQLQMQIAQEKRRQAMTRGEHEIEQARLRAAKWLEKATRRVEQSAAAVAKAEAAVVRASPPSSAATGRPTPPSSPAAVADTLRQAAQPAPERPDESLTVTETIEALRADEEGSTKNHRARNNRLP